MDIDPTPLAVLAPLCGCGNTLDIEMERSAGTCLDCQESEATQKEKAS